MMRNSPKQKSTSLMNDFLRRFAPEPPVLVKFLQRPKPSSKEPQAMPKRPEFVLKRAGVVLKKLEDPFKKLDSWGKVGLNPMAKEFRPTSRFPKPCNMVVFLPIGWEAKED